MGRGHFGRTCYAKGRKGKLKDMPLARQNISKVKVGLLLVDNIVVLFWKLAC